MHLLLRMHKSFAQRHDKPLDFSPGGSFSGEKI